MKVLAIDDQPEVLKQIVAVLSDETGPDGKPFDVTGLTDHKEALKLLGDQFFDIVITDMLMGSGEEDGLEVLRELTEKSPVTIVLTAYPSIPNCVASLRAGAWDYLEKVPSDGSDAYGNILASIKAAHDERLKQKEAGFRNPDSVWAQEHLPELVKDYNGELIAVVDRRVVAHGKDYDELISQVKTERPMARPTVVSLPDTSMEMI